MSVKSDLGRFGIVTAAAMEAIIGHKQGTPAVLAVYVALATHADRSEQEGWRCSVKNLAEQAGISERSVHKAKAVLIELGLLTVTETWVGPKERGWDSYLLHYLPGVVQPLQEVVQPVQVGGAESAVYSSDQETDQETDRAAPSRREDGNPSRRDAAAEGDGERTVNQRANAIARGFYDWITEQTGHKPGSWTMPQMIRLLAPLLSAGRTDLDVKRALVQMHHDGVPYTRQSIERTLNGLSPRRRRDKGPDVDTLQSVYDELLAKETA